MIADTLNKFNVPEGLAKEAIKITASIMTVHLYLYINLNR